MKDRGTYFDNLDDSDFLSLFGDDVVYIGRRPNDFENNYDWANATLQTAYSGGKKITTENNEDKNFLLYETDQNVVAFDEDFSEVSLFEHDDFESYRVHMVSDHLLGYLEELDMGVDEVKAIEGITEDEIVDIVEDILSGSYFEANEPEWNGNLGSYLREKNIDFLPKGEVYRLKHSNHLLNLRDDGSITVGRIESKERGFKLQHFKDLESKEELDKFLEKL